VPTKAIYATFETSPDQEFDHYLVEKLGWRSVAEMRRSMSAMEWLRWHVYYGRKAQRHEIAAAGG
jgi:hypothetical protein